MIMTEMLIPISSPPCFHCGKDDFHHSTCKGHEVIVQDGQEYQIGGLIGNCQATDKERVGTRYNRSTKKWGLWNETRSSWVSPPFDTREEAARAFCPESYFGTHSWVYNRCINCCIER